MRLEFRERLQRTPLSYFLLMLIRPAWAIERILAEQPVFPSLIIFLTFISLLRGILDGVLALMTDGQFFALWQSGRLISWFLLKAYPLLLADWLAGYVRWFGFALVVYVLGRLCGGRGKLTEHIRLYGIALGIYVVTVLPNFAYFFAPLPMLRFEVAPNYSPTLGVGQLLTTSWLVWVSFLIVKRLHGLAWFESAAIGLLAPLLNISALVLPVVLIFNLPQAVTWGQTTVAYTTLLGFSAFSIGFVLLCILVTLWFVRRERKTLTPDS